MSETLYQAPTIRPEEYEKYRGRHVAIHEGKIIADGSNSVEAFRKALKKKPGLRSDQIALYYVNIADVLVL